MLPFYLVWLGCYIGDTALFENLVDILKRFIKVIATRLPNDVLEFLEKARSVDSSGLAGLAYKVVFDNLDVALCEGIMIY